MSHISDEELERYAIGALPEPKLATFEEHLLICHFCQDRLRAADEYIAALRGAAKQLDEEGRTE